MKKQYLALIAVLILLVIGCKAKPTIEVSNTDATAQTKVASLDASTETLVKPSTEITTASSTVASLEEKSEEVAMKTTTPIEVKASDTVTISEKTKSIIELYNRRRTETKALNPNLGQGAKAYEAYLMALDLTDIDVIDQAAKDLNQFITEDNGDALYFAFTDFHQMMIEVLEFYKEGYDIQTLNQNGYMVLFAEGMPDTYEDPAYLFKRFGAMLSTALAEDLGLKVKEQAQHVDTYMIMDAGMWITWEELATRILDNEAYYNKYVEDPNYGYLAEERLKTNDFYLRLYLGEVVMDNTPPYEFEHRMVDTELIDSYRVFIEEHQDSRYIAAIKRVLTMFEDNGFYYDDDTFNSTYIDLFGQRLW